MWKSEITWYFLIRFRWREAAVSVCVWGSSTLSSFAFEGCVCVCRKELHTDFVSVLWALSVILIFPDICSERLEVCFILSLTHSSANNTCSSERQSYRELVWAHSLLTSVVTTQQSRRILRKGYTVLCCDVIAVISISPFRSQSWIIIHGIV